MQIINRARATALFFITAGAGGIAWFVKDLEDSLRFIDTRAVDYDFNEDNQDSKQKDISKNRTNENKNNKKSSDPIIATDNSNFLPVVKNSQQYFKFLYAKKLLTLSESSIQSFRLKAVERLAKIRDLNNAHFKVLAYHCDSRTAVALARYPNIDLNWFHATPLRYVNSDIGLLQTKAKEFLMVLCQRSQHKCLSYFISKVFFEGHDSKFSEKFLEPSELVKHIKSHKDILPLCVESILHHSTIPKYANDIVLLNGLYLLYEIYLKFEHDESICKNLAEILLNVSIFPNSLEQFYRAGWIKVLAQWCNKSDLSLSTTAACTLANLDEDDKRHGKCSRQLYLLHPLERDATINDVDVILVHGLLGGVFYTWRQRDKIYDLKSNKAESKSNISNEENFKAMVTKLENVITEKNFDKDYEFVLNDIPLKESSDDNCGHLLTCERNHKCIKQTEKENNTYTKCWPRDWLIKDCDNINIRLLGINYRTRLSMWAPICPEERAKFNLVERSSELMSKLVEAGVGDRPIIWITHSMGGLIVKHMLIKARESDNASKKKILDNSKGIVFFSTPHRGSTLAAMNPATALLLWPSTDLVELRHDSVLLMDIQDKFMELLKEYPMKTVSFVETKSTLVKPFRMTMRFVEENSADLGVGESYLIPLDHLNICKPINRQSFLYQKIVQIIEEVYDQHKETLRK